MKEYSKTLLGVIELMHQAICEMGEEIADLEQDLNLCESENKNLKREIKRLKENPMTEIVPNITNEAEYYQFKCDELSTVNKDLHTKIKELEKKGQSTSSEGKKV